MKATENVLFYFFGGNQVVLEKKNAWKKFNVFYKKIKKSNIATKNTFCDA